MQSMFSREPILPPGEEAVWRLQPWVAPLKIYQNYLIIILDIIISFFLRESWLMTHHYIVTSFSCLKRNNLIDETSTAHSSYTLLKKKRKLNLSIFPGVPGSLSTCQLGLTPQPTNHHGYQGPHYTTYHWHYFPMGNLKGFLSDRKMDMNNGILSECQSATDLKNMIRRMTISWPYWVGTRQLSCSSFSGTPVVNHQDVAFASFWFDIGLIKLAGKPHVFEVFLCVFRFPNIKHVKVKKITLFSSQRHKIRSSYFFI